MRRHGRADDPPARSPVSIGAARARPPLGSPPVPGDAVAAAWDALRCVYDPELCVDVVSLGLVYTVRERCGGIVVEMTLTTQGCPASESLPELARAAVVERVGVDTPVEVRVVWEPAWTPAMMDEEAAAALGLRIG